MKNPLVISLAAALCCANTFGQGTVYFNNRWPQSVICHVYGYDATLPPQVGNGPDDYPPGTNDYTGYPLVSGTRYSAQLWAISGADQPENSLLGATPIKTFREGIAAGFVEATIATLAGVPMDTPVATIQLRVWNNLGGTLPTWDEAVKAGVPIGKSPVFNLQAIGGQVNYAPSLVGLQSFSLAISKPSPGIWNCGVGINGFGLTVTGTNGLAFVIEASANLTDLTWVPLATNTLTGGTSYFSDPQWTNYPGRFYRLRLP